MKGDSQPWQTRTKTKINKNLTRAEKPGIIYLRNKLCTQADIHRAPMEKYTHAHTPYLPGPPLGASVTAVREQKAHTS